MPWEEIYPILSDCMLARYRSEVTEHEKEELRHHFSVAEIINRKRSAAIVSTSLFYKPSDTSFSFPPLNEKALRSPEESGIRGRFHPWKHYVAPILEGSERLAREWPEASFRVYLAQDMRFMVPHLLKQDCEIFLMESSSLAHSPGSMWRFLALEDEIPFCSVDADLAPLALENLRRSLMAANRGLPFWRIANVYCDEPNNKPVTVLAPQWGGRGPLPISELLEAFVWFRQRGELEGIRNPTTGECHTLADGFSRWPLYGSDEWFLTVALFPRMAEKGILTLLDVGGQTKHWGALDIEFCMRMNPRSEIVLLGLERP